jgi:membrane-associated phospholipid phosphatase
MLIALGLALASLFFFGWLAEEMKENETAHFDDLVRNAVHAFASPGATDFFRFWSDLNGPVALFIFTGLVVAWAWWKSYRTTAVLMAVMMVGGTLMDGALKLAFHRARPTPYFGLSAPHDYSFPSGHSLMSFCFYGTAAYLIGAHLKTLPMRIAVRVLAGVIVLLVGVSRIYLGVHYPSDVVAGFAAGLVWLTGIIFAYQRITGNKR